MFCLKMFPNVGTKYCFIEVSYLEICQSKNSEKKNVMGHKYESQQLISQSCVHVVICVSFRCLCLMWVERHGSPTTGAW